MLKPVPSPEPIPSLKHDHYLRFDRPDWAKLRSNVPMTLTERQILDLRGINEPMSVRDVEEVFLPLTRLINLRFAAARALGRVTDDFVGRPSPRRTYIIGIAGSVAVGKSTVARLLRALLSRWPDHPKVELVTTDGFLLPRSEMIERDLMKRKGFPESYDQRRMLQFLSDVSENGYAEAPVYSHEAYDIIDQTYVVDKPDILIFEGLNVLQVGGGPDKATAAVVASDFFDISIYIDAEEADIESWYVDRFMLMQKTAFQKPSSYFHHVAAMPVDEARDMARQLWNGINRVNLEQNIAPTRCRADVVLHKGNDHRVDWLQLKRF